MFIPLNIFNRQFTISICIQQSKTCLYIFPYLLSRRCSTKLNNFLSFISKNNVDTHIHKSVSVATLNLTHINVNTKLSTLATASDGNCYENNVYKRLIDIFGESNVARECDISKLLHSFKIQIPKSQLQGIDFIIRAKYNEVWTLFAIQVKIGAGTRDISHVIPFIRTLRILRQFVTHNTNHSIHGLQIIPIWVSSACLNKSAEIFLKKNCVHCFIDSAWSIDIENCSLFTNFINKLLINVNS